VLASALITYIVPAMPVRAVNAGVKVLKGVEAAPEAESDPLTGSI